MLLLLYKKIFGKRQPDSSAERDDSLPLEQKLELIRQGDSQLRNQLIQDYQPYVAKVTSRFCNRYIDPARDDEYSIALSAFNEAIEQFSPVSGRSFLSFAETVIRRRLIDFARKQTRFTKQIPYSSFEVEDDEDNVINPVEIREAMNHYERNRQNEERKQEIIDFTAALRGFGIAFADLVDGSPKHVDSRTSLLEIAKGLAQEPAMLDQLTTKKMLPIKELLEVTQVSRKTLERNRKFIIAVTLIYSGPYPHLQDYIKSGTPNAAAEGEDEHG